MSTAYRALCEKLGFGSLNDEELARVVARVERDGPFEALGAALSRAADPCVPFPLDGPDGFTVGGTVAPGYERVREAFESNYRAGLERDSQLCVYKDGEVVVDLFGSNHALSTCLDEESSATEYGPETLQIVFSSTKTVTSAVFALAADRGVLDYNDKVSKHWPEFSSARTARKT